MDIYSKKRGLNYVDIRPKKTVKIETPFTQAIIDKDESKIKRLIDNKQYLNDVNFYGSSPLLLSIKFDNFDLFLKLLKMKETDINNNNNSYKWSPLSYATALGEKGIKFVLAILGFDRNKPVIPDYNDGISLLLSVALRLPKEFCYHKPKVDLPIINGKTSLMIAAKNFKMLYVLEKLLQSGADVNKVDNNLNSAIIIAVNSNNINAVKLLIKYKANVNQINKFKQSSLFLAVIKENLEMVTLLINNGANLKYKPKNNVSILGAAVINSKKNKNCLEILKIILDS